MELHDLIVKNRSYRRFLQTASVERHLLEELVELARLSPSAQNLQPLKYFLSCDPETNAVICRHLGWAGYLKSWSGPKEGERPAAYILMMGDTSITNTFDIDAGIAAQSIMLGAMEKGLGSCLIGSIQRKSLAKQLSLAPGLEILLAVCLGRPLETVQLERVNEQGDIRYWRDEKEIHHVPKRSLNDLIINSTPSPKKITKPF